MCIVLIGVPLITETRDSLIGCGILLSGLFPYFLWRNQKYSPKWLIKFSNKIESLTQKLTQKLQLVLPVIPGQLPDK